MKSKFYLSLIGAAFLSVAVNAEDVVLPTGMSKISGNLVLTVTDNVNRAKCTKPLVKLPNGSLIFTAQEDTYGEELYIYKDGAVSLIKDIVPGSGGSDPKYLTVVGDKVFFTATTADAGNELWVTDGTESGTKMVKDIYSGATGSAPFGLTAFNGKCLFFAFNEDSELNPVISSSSTDEHWLWTSDGTEAGTTRIADVPTRTGIDGNAGYIVPCGKKAFFVGYDAVDNETLYTTDGTSTGTGAVMNIDPATTSPGNFSTDAASIDWITNMNDSIVIFRATTVAAMTNGAGDVGNEIWVSDGTAAGTHWVGKDLAAGSTNSVPNNTEFAFPVYYKGKCYFRAKDGVHGCEPCVTDFTAAGTHNICDINHWNDDPTSDSWGPEFPYVWKGYIFCQANGSWYDSSYVASNPSASYHDSGYSLWRYNLAEGGTPVTDWFAAVDGATTLGYEYQANWDGGTEIYAGNNSDNPGWFTACGGRLYFRCSDAANNSELWEMDGVSSLPKKVVDLTDNTKPHNLLAVDNTLYFVTSTTSTTTQALYAYAPDPLTSINTTKSASALSAYYNASAKTLEISSDAKLVRLFDATGRLVSSYSNTQSISTANLAEGLYIYQVTGADGQAYSNKFIR